MPTSILSPSNGNGPGPGPLRVMVCDDSAVIRGLLTRALEAENDISVVASVANGEMAINALKRHDVEVIVLDIEMPVMDGLTALPKLVQQDPNVQIIMASTLTLQNAEISLRALAAGAADYIAKPTSRSEIHSADDFRRELVTKVRELGAVRRKRAGTAMPLPAGDSGSLTAVRPAGVPSGRDGTPVRPADPGSGRGTATRAELPVMPRVELKRREKGPIVLRRAAMERPDVVAIGSSTGGPQALFNVLSHVKGKVRQPIFITQHMPATFTTILAEHIGRASGVETAEAKDGESVRQDRIYVAPGDFHMVVEDQGGKRVVRLQQTPPENFCRPSVDPMLRSLVRIYGRRILAIILTGMGHDGLNGGQAVVDAGGTVIAQDEATSVVWGMPGAVATAGLCSAVLPIDEIGPHLAKAAVSVAA